MSSNQLVPKLFACSQSTELAEKIAKGYGAELGKVTSTHFSYGEFQPAF
jgi:ribose-phosphate pyrophosphokinase